jgi:hypothetical protein
MVNPVSLEIPEKNGFFDSTHRRVSGNPTSPAIHETTIGI